MSGLPLKMTRFSRTIRSNKWLAHFFVGILSKKKFISELDI